MPAFEYSALDQRGRTRSGVLDGDNPRQVRQRLRERGLSPLSVSSVATGDQLTRWSIRDRVSPRDLALIMRQLATLVRTGLPVDQALQMTAKQTTKPRLQHVLAGVRAKVIEGHSLAMGLAQFPAVFPALYRATVTAGEHSGKLDQVLESLADYSERRHALRQSITLALFYPALLTIVALAIVSGLLAYVVPQVVQVFDSVDATLPLLTRMLITTSSLTRSAGPWILFAGLLATVGGVFLLRMPGPQRRAHRIMLWLPLVGRIHGALHIARFTRTLGILASSGVSIVESLRIATQVIGNRVLKDAVESTAQRVREGSSLNRALERTGHFPPLLIHLIASGETGGNLDEMLLHAADSQERDLEALIATLVTLFEPLLILVMGGIVLAIVIAILLPVFELNRLIQ